MNKKIEKIERIEREIARLGKICTIGVQPKIKKLNAQLCKAFEAVSKDKKAIAEYEEIYGCEFEYEAD